MTGQRSTTLQQFLDSLMQLPSSYDEYQRLSSLDVASLEGLADDELEVAHDALIERLDSVPDERVARALGAFETPECERALWRAVEKWQNDPHDRGATAAEALRSLLRQGNVEDPVATIVDTMKQLGPDGRARLVAEIAGYDDDAVRDVLLSTLETDDKGARRQAAIALVKLIGFEREVEMGGTYPWILRAYLASEYESLRTYAWSRLTELIAQRERGELSDTEMKPDRSDAMERYSQSVLDENAEQWSDDFDLDALRALTGVERDWVIYSLIRQVDGTAMLTPERDASWYDDPRVPRALEAMDATIALEPLKRALERAEGEFRVDVEEAIDYLEEVLADETP